MTTPAQMKGLQYAVENGKPYPITGYRHNARQWAMWQRMVADGLLKKDLSITAKGRKVLANG